jgi:REP element-mobilizing transposase RayT
MSRPLRVQFPYAVLYLTNRGNEGCAIFFDDADRVHFLELLARCVTRFGWKLTAYVLMTNHFHLVIELTSRTLSRGMQWFDGEYAKWFNLKHDRVGHLYQRRFETRVIEKPMYHRDVLRHVVLNPVRAGIVNVPEAYEWSSYRATAGLADAPEWLDVHGVLATFGDEAVIARYRYREFIAASDGKSPWDDLVGGMYLGSEEWLNQVRKHIESRAIDAEHPRRQRLLRAIDFFDVIAAVSGEFRVPPDQIRSRYGGDARLLSAWIGSRECCLPLKTIAAGLRIRNGSSVSLMAKECDAKLCANAEFRASLQRCRELLYIL